MEIVIKKQPIEEAEKIKIEYANWNMTEYLPETYAQIVYDETGFTVKFVVKEANPQTDRKQHLDPVSLDSCVEFFANFDPEHSNKYINFEVNAIGKMYSAFRTDRYDPERLTIEEIEGLCIKTTMEKEEWSATYHIGEAFLQKKYPGFTMEKCKYIKGNLYQCGNENKPEHYLSLFPVGTEKPDFHRPEYFGVMRLE